MSNYAVGANNILLSNYIKYDRLTELYNALFAYDQLPDHIDIYIDLFSITYGLYNPTYNMALDVSELDISACIINMIAHYRRFFRSKNINTRFILVYSINANPICNKFVPNFNSGIYNVSQRNYNNAIYQHILNNIFKVEMISKYLSDVIFISGLFDTTTIMYDAMFTLDGNNLGYNKKIVITKDIVTMQLLAIMPNVIILRPKKHKGEDISYFVGFGGGLYNHLIEKRKIKYELSTKISDGLYTFILAASKVPERGLKSIINLDVIFKEIERLIKEEPDFYNGYNTDINNICDKLSPKICAKLKYGNIDGRFKCLDAVYMRSIYYFSPEKKSKIIEFQNLYDPNAIHDIDTEFYSKNHLNLEYL